VSWQKEAKDRQRGRRGWPPSPHLVRTASQLLIAWEMGSSPKGSLGARGLYSHPASLPLPANISKGTIRGPAQTQEGSSEPELFGQGDLQSSKHRGQEGAELRAGDLLREMVTWQNAEQQVAGLRRKVTT
jgi:hypothetical protein